MNYSRIAEKLRRGENIILDGGTGTDMQRRGAVMNGDTWCADANLTQPEIVRAVHRGYIEAGADIITANTFATSPLLFSYLARTADMTRIDTVAVALAKESAAGFDVCVAGSISTMRPVIAGGDRNINVDIDESEVRALYRQKADGLKAAGCDLLLMELMRDTDYAVLASEAALATGLPVWIGISTERGKNGVLQGWGRDDCSLDDITRALTALNPAVMMIMHTSPNDTDEALGVLRRYWRGPIATYPECGYFESPDWRFVDVIPPAALVQKSLAWRSLGTTIFGGCCGIGPEHISALSHALADRSNRTQMAD
jgi:S-methylmethionine-dependent homocysteine/selenocysteine methylase